MRHSLTRRPRHFAIVLLFACLGTGVSQRPALVQAAGHADASVWVAKGSTSAGWPGPKSTYLGRYHLTASSDSTLAVSGELTIFTRIPKGQKTPALSGILSLYTTAQSNVLYLTKFAETKGTLFTTVNLGIFTGPALGKFTIKRIGNGHITALLTGQGVHATLQFARFSKNPHP